MKRVEVKLSLPAVKPLLALIRSASDPLERQLAVSPLMPDLDRDLRDTWNAELLSSQSSEVRTLLQLFEGDFPETGVISFDAGNAEATARACSAVRLQLRARFLPEVNDEALETGQIDFGSLAGNVRDAFMAYLFLATIQELIIEHLDSSILDL